MEIDQGRLILLKYHLNPSFREVKVLSLTLSADVKLKMFSIFFLKFSTLFPKPITSFSRIYILRNPLADKYFFVIHRDETTDEEFINDVKTIIG